MPVIRMPVHIFNDNISSFQGHLEKSNFQLKSKDKIIQPKGPKYDNFEKYVITVWIPNTDDHLELFFSLLDDIECKKDNPQKWTCKYITETKKGKFSSIIKLYPMSLVFAFVASAIPTTLGLVTVSIDSMISPFREIFIGGSIISYLWPVPVKLKQKYSEYEKSLSNYKKN